MKIQSIGCMKCHNAEEIREDSARLKGKWPAWEPGLQEFPCPKCGGGPVWATQPRDEGTAPDAPRHEEMRCFRGEGEDGWAVDVVLFAHQVAGEVRAYQDDVLQWRHPIGLEEIALFASKRSDLVGQYLDGLLKLYRVH